jgi:hypothetical protein
VFICVLTMAQQSINWFLQRWLKFYVRAFAVS